MYINRKSSKYVGVGLSLSSSGRRCYFVARFWPAGNLDGKYLDNVYPPNGSNPIFSYNLLILIFPFIKFLIFS